MMPRNDILSELIDILIVHFATESERRALLYRSIGDSPIYRRIDLSGDPLGFTERLLEKLQGTDLHGKRALEALLLTVREQVGYDVQTEIDRLIPSLGLLFITPNDVRIVTPRVPIPIRVFLSSPGDVADERSLARRVVDDLRGDPFLRDSISPRAIAWEDPSSRTPMLATLSPQEAIDRGLPRPSECEIVVVILWSRLGTPLDGAKYRKPDGSIYLSGTEWEFESAMEVSERTGSKPYVLVYRRTESPLLSLDDPDKEEKEGQYQRVKAFFEAFRNPDGSWRRSYWEYSTPEDFRKYLEYDLRVLIKEILQNANEIVGVNLKPDTVPIRPLWNLNKSPFPGLRAFTPSDAPVFFGRGRETDGLVKRLSTDHFVAVVGASGSGKSSLVGAGLLPRLIGGAIEGSKDWIWLRFTPGGVGENPFMALSVELKGLIAGSDARSLARELELQPAIIEDFGQRALLDKPDWANLLLFIDQFEELFTLCSADKVVPFAALLSTAARSPRLRVVITMRSDFYHRCVDVSILAGLLKNGSYPLAIPEPIDLIEMIERPANVANLSLADGLARYIVRETGTEPGGLALMAYLLDELYKLARSQGNRTLTHEDYQSLGGVKGAIGTRAESTFVALVGDERGKMQALRRVFLKLIEVDDYGVATRQRARLTTIAENSDDLALVNSFVDAQLLVTTETEDHQPQVEVAHEALFISWYRIEELIKETQAELAEQRFNRALVRRTELRAQKWFEEGKPDTLLPHPEEIGQIRKAFENVVPIDTIRSPFLPEFIKSEEERLVAELSLPHTSHERRRNIGDRLSMIGDPRKGISVKNGIPDTLWLPVFPGGEIEVDGVRFGVKPFYIAKYLITYEQYAAFVEAADGFENERWWTEMPIEYQRQEIEEQRTKAANAPRDSISWYQSVAFARWFSRRLRGLELVLPNDETLYVGDNAEIRLPFEWEWQWAAQAGTKERAYPWGDAQDDHTNTSEAGLNRSTAVGMYPHGQAECGALDIAGNLYEWCQNDRYDHTMLNGINNGQSKTLRGGSFYRTLSLASSVCRSDGSPHLRNDHYGLRLVVAQMSP